jgi:hypothetical protein
LEGERLRSLLNTIPFYNFCSTQGCALGRRGERPIGPAVA